MFRLGWALHLLSSFRVLFRFIGPVVAMMMASDVVNQFTPPLVATSPLVGFADAAFVFPSEAWPPSSVFDTPLNGTVLACPSSLNFTTGTAPESIRIFAPSLRNVAVHIACDIGLGGIEIVATGAASANASSPAPGWWYHDLQIISRGSGGGAATAEVDAAIDRMVGGIFNLTVTLSNVTVLGPVRIAAVGPVVNTTLALSHVNAASIPVCGEALNMTGAQANDTASTFDFATLADNPHAQFSVAAVGIVSESFVLGSQVRVTNSSIGCNQLGAGTIAPVAAISAYGGLVGIAAPGANNSVVRVSNSTIVARDAYVTTVAAVGAVGIALGRSGGAAVSGAASSSNRLFASRNLEVVLNSSSVTCWYLSLSSPASSDRKYPVPATVGAVGIAVSNNATLTAAAVTVRGSGAAAEGGSSAVGPFAITVAELIRRSVAMAPSDFNFTGVGAVGIAFIAPRNPARVGPSFSVDVRGFGVTVTVGRLAAAGFNSLVGHVGIALLARGLVGDDVTPSFVIASEVAAPTVYLGDGAAVGGENTEALMLVVATSIGLGVTDRVVRNAVFGIGISAACQHGTTDDGFCYPGTISSLTVTVMHDETLTASVASQSFAGTSVDATVVRHAVGGVGMAVEGVYASIATPLLSMVLVCDNFKLLVKLAVASAAAADGISARGIVGGVGSVLSQVGGRDGSIAAPTVLVTGQSTLRVLLPPASPASDSFATMRYLVGAAGLVVIDASLVGSTWITIDRSSDVTVTSSASPLVNATTSMPDLALSVPVAVTDSAVGAVGFLVAAQAIVVGGPVMLSIGGNSRITVGAVEAESGVIVGAVGFVITDDARLAPSPIILARDAEIHLGALHISLSSAPNMSAAAAAIVGAVGIVGNALRTQVLSSPVVNLMEFVTVSIGRISASSASSLAAFVGGVGVALCGARTSGPYISFGRSTLALDKVALAAARIDGFVGAAGIAVAPHAALSLAATVRLIDMQLTASTATVGSLLLLAPPGAVTTATSTTVRAFVAAVGCGLAAVDAALVPIAGIRLGLVAQSRVSVNVTATTSTGSYEAVVGAFGVAAFNASRSSDWTVILTGNVAVSSRADVVAQSLSSWVGAVGVAISNARDPVLGFPIEGVATAPTITQTSINNPPTSITSIQNITRINDLQSQALRGAVFGIGIALTSVDCVGGRVELSSATVLVGGIGYIMAAASQEGLGATGVDFTERVIAARASDDTIWSARVGAIGIAASYADDFTAHFDLANASVTVASTDVRVWGLSGGSRGTVGGIGIASHNRAFIDGTVSVNVSATTAVIVAGTAVDVLNVGLVSTVGGIGVSVYNPPAGGSYDFFRNTSRVIVIVSDTALSVTYLWNNTLFATVGAVGISLFAIVNAVDALETVLSVSVAQSQVVADLTLPYTVISNVGAVGIAAMGCASGGVVRMSGPKTIARVLFRRVGADVFVMDSSAAIVGAVGAALFNSVSVGASVLVEGGAAVHVEWALLRGLLIGPQGVVRAVGLAFGFSAQNAGSIAQVNVTNATINAPFADSMADGNQTTRQPLVGAALIVPSGRVNARVRVDHAVMNCGSSLCIGAFTDGVLADPPNATTTGPLVSITNVTISACLDGALVAAVQAKKQEGIGEVVKDVPYGFAYFGSLTGRVGDSANASVVAYPLALAAATLSLAACAVTTPTATMRPGGATASFSASATYRTTASHDTASHSASATKGTTASPASGSVSQFGSLSSGSATPSWTQDATASASGRTQTFTARLAVKPAVPNPTTRGVAVAGSTLGVVSQFAIRGIISPTAGVRAVSIARLIARLESGGGCGGDDPAVAPDWLSSPLQLRIAGDYLVGTAVGAPIFVLIGAALGGAIGVLSVYLRQLWRTQRQMRGGHSAVADYLHSAVVGACRMAICLSMLLVQPAFAAAVTVAANVHGLSILPRPTDADPPTTTTDGGLAVAAWLCAGLVLLVPCALVAAAAHLCGLELELASPTAHRHKRKRVFVATSKNSDGELSVRSAALLARGGMARGGAAWRLRLFLTSMGEWKQGVHSQGQRRDPADEQRMEPRGQSELTSRSLLLPDDDNSLLRFPRFVVAPPAAVTPPRPVTWATAACSAAFDAAVAEYRPHVGYYSVLAIAIQALQGVAQAAGAIIAAYSSGDTNDATCTVAAWANVATLAAAAFFLVWLRPFTAVSAYRAEVLPTWMQLWASVPVALIASQNWGSSSFSSSTRAVLALADSVAAASSLLQIVVAVVPTVIDAFV